MAKSLVIVESFAKAKTINRILGSSYKVVSSLGHVRDLPRSRLGVDIDEDFSPSYVIPKKNKKLVNELKQEAGKAETVYLAPDPDREGEAIAWHLQEVLKKEASSFKRVTFNEITDTAIREAFSHPGPVDFRKVESQQSRRILDRIVGYKLSPLLWRKVGRGLSAGRVQSVAVKLICDREKEIDSFTPQEYWTIEAEFQKRAEPRDPFKARLAKIEGKKVEIGSRESADEIVEDASRREYHVTSIEKKKQQRRPAPPFITSTMQQAAVNKLHWPIAKTMRIAQQLYEGLDIGGEGTVGLITYMRTDSFRIAPPAREQARDFICSNYGDRYAPAKPNVYRARKGAQEAHEAIRPTSITRIPGKLKQHLSKEQYALYELIWKRFTASQMSPALLEKCRVSISGEKYLFTANDTTVLFDGFLKVSGDTVREKDENELPPLREKEPLDLHELLPEQHFTKPPPRYSEATLVRELEAKGIGRPSTYAPIISTIQKRTYAKKEKGRFHPSPLGKLVNDLLVSGFPEFINVKFTARMEDELDAIEAGKRERAGVLREFYDSFTAALEKAHHTMKSVKKPPEPTSATCEKCGSPMVIRHTLRGEFLACSSFPNCRNINRVTIKENGSFEIHKDALLDEQCPRCYSQLMERFGRYGKFISCSAFPKCRYVKPNYVGIKCPREGCDGDLVEKKGKGKRKFYGCSNYPKCRFTTSSLDKLHTEQDYQ